MTAIEDSTTVFGVGASEPDVEAALLPKVSEMDAPEVPVERDGEKTSVASEIRLVLAINPVVVLLAKPLKRAALYATTTPSDGFDASTLLNIMQPFSAFITASH
jgi:hypothetical protein